jgi:D-proline reductase (dithiol) PrdB
MAKAVDSYRFVRGVTRLLVRQWVSREPERAVPWTPVEKSLAESTVALVSSAGIALATDRPFDQEGERRNPWWGDPSFRVLPRTTTSPDIRVCHLHVNPRNAEQDLNCLFPIERLNELEAAGEVGRAAPRHYSTMGYILEPTVLLGETVPAIVRLMREDGVDLAALVPS